jgi:hypothetical protein
LAVTAAALLDAFDAETLLAAAAGVADSRSRGENDETSAGSPPRDFATRDDVDALVRAGIFRVTNTAERKRAEDPCSSDSSEDFSDASVSRVTVSFASPDDSAPENEKRRSVIASGKNKPRVAARDTERTSLAFASGRVRDAALSMLTDAARRPANRAVASHLESSLNQEMRNALRAQKKKKKSARASRRTPRQVPRMPFLKTPPCSPTSPRTGPPPAAGHAPGGVWRSPARRSWRAGRAVPRCARRGSSRRR